MCYSRHLVRYIEYSSIHIGVISHCAIALEGFSRIALADISIVF